MGKYWDKLSKSDDVIESLAEAAIQTSYEVRALALEGRLSSVDASYNEARKNLTNLIPAIPDSDILRAEGLTFRLQDIVRCATSPNQNHIAEANAMLDSVRARPAYQALVAKPY